MEPCWCSVSELANWWGEPDSEERLILESITCREWDGKGKQIEMLVS